MSFKNLNASQKKMYLFAIYTIDTLKTQGIVREDFDTFHVDLSLIDSFDYDAYSNEYKSHFKKPRATKILKHSSHAVRDSSDDVVVSVANAFYENEDDNPICFDMNAFTRDAGAVAEAGAGAGAGAVAEVGEVVAEKPKRKNNRKPKAVAVENTGVVTNVCVADVDSMVDMLSASLNDMRIELNTISTDIQTSVVTDVAEKPKRKYTRKPKASVPELVVEKENTVADDMDALTASMNAMNVAEVAEVVPVAEKPKRKNTKKTKAEVGAEVGEGVAEVVPVAEKPKRKNTKKTKAEVGEVVAEVGEVGEVAEKPKRKYTKKTAVQYIDETVPEIAVKIVTAAIQGTEEVSIATDEDHIDNRVFEIQDPKIHICVGTDYEESHPIVRSGTPILHNSCEEESYVEDEGEGDGEGEDEDEYEDIVTRKVTIRGKDYLIDENNKVYDYVTQKTVGKYSSDDVELF